MLASQLASLWAEGTQRAKCAIHKATKILLVVFGFVFPVLSSLVIFSLFITPLVIPSLVITSLAISPPLAHAADNQARNNLEDILSSIKSLRGDFTQYEYDSNGNTLRILSGKFRMTRPLLLRWEVAPPFAQTIISNGTNILIYDEELRQLIIRPLDKNNLPPFFFLGGNKAILDAMDISQPDTSAPIFFLSDEQNTQGISVYFRNNIPREINWDTELNQKIVMKFDNIKKNWRNPRSQFNLVPPPGTDIIVEQ